MSGKRWDAMTPVEYKDKQGNTKTRWVRCGVAFEGRDGRGPSIKLDVLPTNGKLECFEPRDKDQPSRGQDPDWARGGDGF